MALSDALDGVLEQLRAMGATVEPFLVRVSKADAPNYAEVVTCVWPCVRQRLPGRRVADRACVADATAHCAPAPACGQESDGLGHHGPQAARRRVPVRS
jgi:hypothetical protein